MAVSRGVHSDLVVIPKDRWAVGNTDSCVCAPPAGYYRVDSVRSVNRRFRCCARLLQVNRARSLCLETLREPSSTEVLLKFY